MGKYFDCYGRYRISHAVSDVHRNHPHMRDSIDAVIRGETSEYIGRSAFIGIEFEYRFYVDHNHDSVRVEIKECDEGGVDVHRLQRIEREIEPIVSNMLRSPSKELVKHVTDEFNRSHGWTITEHETKNVLINIAEHVGH